MTIQISVTCLLRALKTRSNGWSNGNKWVMHIRAPIGNALDVGHKYRNSLNIKALFGLCKSISGKYSIFRKCYFLERKMFLCVWLHFKKYFEKYFLMFGCVLENTIENTFSTCFSHFLTFSRLPNEYIISFIPQNTNKTQKKIIKSGHFARSRSARCRWCRQMISASSALDDLYSLFFLSPSLSLSLFYFRRPEIIWSKNGNGNDFPLFWLLFSVN